MFMAFRSTLSSRVQSGTLKSFSKSHFIGVTVVHRANFKVSAAVTLGRKAVCPLYKSTSATRRTKLSAANITVRRVSSSPF